MLRYIMDNFAKFFEIGGYGGYVISSFAVASLVIALMFVLALRSLKTAQNNFKKLQKLED